MPDITFKAAEEILAEKSLHPEPAKFHIPEWFKKIPKIIKVKDYEGLSIKACLPFQDSLVAGYILKNPIDQEFNFLVNNDVFVNTKTGGEEDVVSKLHVNVNYGDEKHHTGQLGGEHGGCPFVKMNSDQDFYKIMNPFSITLPKGYSALLTPLLNRPDPRFTPISAIIDDGNPLPPNFPIIIHKKGTWLLKKGEPIIGLIPFKREKWKMKIKTKTKKETSNYLFSYKSVLQRWYRDKFWKKKQWE